MLSGIHTQCAMYLLELAHSLSPISRHSHFSDRGYQNARENPNNRNDNEQLDQREPPPLTRKI